MLKSLAAFVVTLCVAACSTPKAETGSSADSLVATADSTDSELQYVDDAPPDEATPDGSDTPNGGDGEYRIENQNAGLIIDPFRFTLDSATVMEMLGEEATITSIHTEGGVDAEGETYRSYAYYEVTFGSSNLRFFDYSGKHFANIYTPLIPVGDSIVVGISKELFIEKMDLEENAMASDVFTIVDDYGSMSFTFREGKLFYIYLYYEEGT